MMEQMKQKVLLPLLALALGILVWQLYLLTITSAQSDELPKQVPIAAVPVQVKPTVVEHALDQESSRTLSDKQIEYLKLVNELRVTQVKRMIAQDNEAIALAEQNALKAQSTIAQTKAPSNKAVKNNKPVEPVAQSDGLKLIYTGEQDGQWNATINLNGRLFDVVKGTKLPSGDTIAKIDQDVVVLTKNSWKKVLSFYNVTQYPNEITVADNAAKKEAILEKKPVAENSVKKERIPEMKTVVATVNPPKSFSPVKKAVVVAEVKKPETKSAIKSALKLSTPHPMTAGATQLVKSPAAIAQKKLVASAKPVRHPTAHKDIATQVASNHAASKPSIGAVKHPMKISAEHVVIKSAPHPALAVANSAKPLRVYTDIEKQLLTQDPNQFTLQVYSADTLGSVQHFIHENKLKEQAKVYTHFDRANRIQYVVMIEHFQSSEQALVALSKLPIELQQYMPEVKRLSQVQAELRSVPTLSPKSIG